MLFSPRQSYQIKIKIPKSNFSKNLPAYSKQEYLFSSFDLNRSIILGDTRALVADE